VQLGVVVFYRARMPYTKGVCNVVIDPVAVYWLGVFIKVYSSDSLFCTKFFFIGLNNTAGVFVGKTEKSGGNNYHERKPRRKTKEVEEYYR
jgi:hypothetical protein